MPIVLDSDTTLQALSGPAVSSEEEITAARRAFATAQALLAGAPVEVPVTVTVGWHDSSVNPEDGSFAVVRTSAGLDDWIGEILQINASGRIIYAYVLTAADVPTQLSVTRRLFTALNRPTLDELVAQVAPVQ